MAASLSTISGKDGAGSTIAGGIQALDLSGAGTGPWSFANVIVDGIAGSNRATVKAASTAAAATDPALVVALSPNGASFANAPYVLTDVASDQMALTITSTTAVALTVPATATQAVVCVEGNSVRWRSTASGSPTASVGMPLSVGQTVAFQNGLSTLRFISQSGTATI